MGSPRGGDKIKPSLREDVIRNSSLQNLYRPLALELRFWADGVLLPVVFTPGLMENISFEALLLRSLVLLHVVNIFLQKLNRCEEDNYLYMQAGISLPAFFLAIIPPLLRL